MKDDYSIIKYEISVRPTARPPASNAKEYMRSYRADNPEYVLKENKYSKLKMRELRENRPGFRKKQVSTAKQWRADLKRDIFKAYGGVNGSCVCCGEFEPLFLQLDHINNDGGEHRKRLTGKNVGSNCYVLYGELRKLGFPSGYQILCANCNVGKARNKGTCPHKFILVKLVNA